MTIQIAARIKPFSHSLGAKCLLPGTLEVVEAFPHFIRIGNIAIALDNDPFTHPFTLQQDLEKKCVWVFGKSFRYKIQARPDGFEIKEKDKTSFFNAPVRLCFPLEVERLSLGSHKAQDWDLVSRRMDFKEILPPLFFLSQQFSHLSLPTSGMCSLGDIQTVYLSSFEGILVPKNYLDKEKLLSQLFQDIRSLFFTESDTGYHIIMDPSFPEGRMMNLQTKMGSLDFEWSRYRIRRAIFRAKKTGKVLWKLPEKICSFRTKMSRNGKGCTNSAFDPFLVEEGNTYFLDRFFGCEN